VLLTESIRVVLTTAANQEEAERIGRALVEARLAACATIAPRVRSIYWWQGQVESADEALIVLKTDAALLGALEGRLHELHSYQTPEFLVLPVEAASSAYFDWLEASLGRRS
jgi:periplasmic divalent cation tolerance protein